jgi:hypothetical protein
MQHARQHALKTNSNISWHPDRSHDPDVSPCGHCLCATGGGGQGEGATVQNEPAKPVAAPHRPARLPSDTALAPRGWQLPVACGMNRCGWPRHVFGRHAGAARRPACVRSFVGYSLVPIPQAVHVRTLVLSVACVVGASLAQTSAYGHRQRVEYHEPPCRPFPSAAPGCSPGGRAQLGVAPGELGANHPRKYHTVCIPCAASKPKPKPRRAY